MVTGRKRGHLYLSLAVLPICFLDITVTQYTLSTLSTSGTVARNMSVYPGLEKKTQVLTALAGGLMASAVGSTVALHSSIMAWLLILTLLPG